MPGQVNRPDVHICETGPRDGLQILKVFVPTEVKCELIDAIADAGVREIDAASYVPPKVVPQFADVDIVVPHAQKTGASIGVVVPNVKGAERALAADVDTIFFVISASESHNRANVRRTVDEQMGAFKEARSLIDQSNKLKKPKLLGAISTAFGCSIEGRISQDAVRKLATQMAEAGSEEICIADTVGYGNPKQVRELCTAIARDVGKDLPMRLHLHDTLGMGLANAVAGLEAGVRRFDASVSGLGGCPFAPGARGNIVTEDLVFMLEEMGFSTGIDLRKLMKTRAILEPHLPPGSLTGQLHKAGIPKTLWRDA